MKTYVDIDTGLLTKIKNGCNKITRNVAITLGPKGKNVVMREEGLPPVITKDGVTVARFVDFDDPHEDIAAQILKQASIETVNRAGDGTTTSLIIANGIIQESMKWLLTGEGSPTKIKSSLTELVSHLEAVANKMAKQVESKDDIRNIAYISVNGDAEIADLIADAVDAVGKAGSVIVEESREVDSILDYVEGYRIDSGYWGPSFINEKRQNLVKMENPIVLVSDININDVDEFKAFLALAGHARRPLIIIANEISEKPLALAYHAAQSKGTLAVVRPPRYGQERKEILRDLAVSLGANFIAAADRKRISDVKLEDLGSCEMIEAGSTTTLFTGGAGHVDDIDERLTQLEAEVSQTKDDDLIRRLMDRITRLSAGVAVIKVGGITQVDVTERRHRVEDALEAVRMSTSTGLVPGGASISLIMSEYLRRYFAGRGDMRQAVDILSKALEYPFKQLCENADLSFTFLKTKLMEENNQFIQALVDDVDTVDVSKVKCYDFSLDEPAICEAIPTGIVDPTGVLINAIQNSVSASSTLITTGVAIVKHPE